MRTVVLHSSFTAGESTSWRDTAVADGKDADAAFLRSATSTGVTDTEYCSAEFPPPTTYSDGAGAAPTRIFAGIAESERGIPTAFPATQAIGIGCTSGRFGTSASAESGTKRRRWTGQFQF